MVLKVNNNFSSGILVGMQLYQYTSTGVTLKKSGVRKSLSLGAKGNEPSSLGNRLTTKSKIIVFLRY